MKRFLFILLLSVPYLFYWWYSYTQVDPNLVLTSFAPYWSFQQFMWQIGYHQRFLSSALYIAIITLIFCSYLAALRALQSREKFRYLCIVGLLLIFSHNALSHDLFNYMFNAKMVVQYHQDPHVRVALDFPQDEWTRFMHNTHTAAPYGYGWTILSLLPYIVGLNKFNTIFLAFKLFMALGIGLYVWAARKVGAVTHGTKDLWVVLLHPLFLVETLGNGHNDVWMMGLFFTAFVAVFYWQKSAKKRSFSLVLAALMAYVSSISIKFATLATTPVLGVLFAQPLLSSKTVFARSAAIVTRLWPDLSAVLLFIPLLTSRSQFFHPWYLIWSLCFLPWMTIRPLKILLISLSVSSLFRYVPYLYSGTFEGSVLAQQQTVTWVGGLSLALLIWIVSRFLSKR